MIFLMFVFMIVNFTYNFRDYGIKSIDNKATILAETVKHSLTTQMQTGVIDQRHIFLKQLEDLPNINKIWLSRSHQVIEMYGKGLNNEVARDDIDKEVLKTGNEIKIIDEKLFSNSTYRITIPYKAYSTGQINCMNCHTTAKEGDTLGAITITIPVDDSKQMGINTVIDTTGIALILIVAIGFLINYLISPFLKLFDSIKKVMSKAQKGDYSYRVLDVNNKDAQEVIVWVNTLLEKLESTLGNIDSKISIFLSNKQKEELDPLINVKNTVDRLSDVYKFRKTIEHDDTLDEIYERLATMIRRNLNVENFNLLEADTRTGKVHNVYVSKESYCNLDNGCRADKTNDIVDSTRFENVCAACKKDDLNYFCIPYSISNDLDLIVSIYTNSEEETAQVREKLPYLDDYVDSAKTVIISNKLMNILEKNARTDPLTQLYNRKHLEEQIPKITSQANRTSTNYGVLMVDIDHFKMVNDTYGHDVGDKAIKIVAQTLVENTRNSDVVVRFGGEEFIVLLYNCDEESIVDVANKIRLAFLNKEIPAGNTTIKKTMSVGASMFPAHHKDLDACIKFADLALYEAKNTGRNKVILFTEELAKKES
ncbi:GGDEF domain-containing protein [Poseidonibacter lekithochrous]|uniref:GGDEF domain-containing protein n=1 Tax=Poseidonibacter lekithochrous TaxID=1904463 RepID=UPI0009F9BB5B|nr:GGDEF domain-containing protein [Poseidonibacter lekithochrous]QKJ21765.1 diguanylate cyclase [Poseidonibacter lekithochrous]